MDKTPVITKEVVEYLEYLYPDKMPDITESDKMIAFKAGNVDVVRTCKRIYEDQQDNIMSL